MSYELPNSKLEFDPQRYLTDLRRAAETIDDEVKTLEDATKVTQEILNMEFTI
jgi:hypothetical protein